MRLFNSVQVVAIYAAAPFVIGWLFGAEFEYHRVAAYSASALYAVLSLMMVGCVYSSSRWFD